MSVDRPPITTTKTRPLWKDALLWIFLLGLVVRIGHGVVLSQTIYDEINLRFDQGDTYAFYQWAQEILAGDLLGRDTFHTYVEWMEDYGDREDWHRWWGGEPVFHQAPLYPYLLAGLLYLTAGSINGVFMIQLIIGSLQTLLLYALGKHLFNRRTGLWAALLCALYGPFIFHQGTLLRDWMMPMIEPTALLLLLLAWRRDRWWMWLGGGGVLALAYLAKPSVLLLTLAVLAFVIGVHGLHVWKPKWGRSPRGLPRRLGLLVAGLVIVLMPLMVRNHLVGAPLIAVSTRGPEALIQGNAVDAQPVGYHRPESMADLLRHGDGDNKKMIMKLLADYEGDYGKLVWLQVQKWLYLFDTAELPNNLDIVYGRELSPVLRPMLSYSIVLPLALVGLFLARRRIARRPLAFSMALLFLLTMMAVLTIPLMLGRYRMAIVPYLMLFAGWGLTWVVTHVQHRRFGAVAAWVAGVGLCVVLQQYVVFHALQIDRLKMTFHAPEYLLSRDIHLDYYRFGDAADAVGKMLDSWKARGGGWYPDEDLLRMEELGHRLKAADRFLEDGNPDAARVHLLEAERSFKAFEHDQGQPFFDIAVYWRKIGDKENLRRNLEEYIERQPTGFDVSIAKRWLKELDEEE